ncbi:MAG: TIGR04086 family membrane protein [Clostridia bacterium]|nr:TIGR04086 family membrane protein [Clostridia bacterium]
MEKKTIANAILDVVRALAVALLTNLVAVLLIAVVVKYTGVTQSVATALNQVVKVLSLAVGAVVGFRSGRFGLVLGAVTGLLFTVLGFSVFSLLAGRPLFTDVTVFDFLLGLASGVFSGVLAVNLRTLSHAKRPTRCHRQRSRA